MTDERPDMEPVLAALRAKGVTIQDAYWRWNGMSEEWDFRIVTPDVETIGPHDIYSYAWDACQKAGRDVMALRLGTTEMFAHRDAWGSDDEPEEDCLRRDLAAAQARVAELERERDESLMLAGSCSSLHELAGASVSAAARIVELETRIAELEGENARLRSALDDNRRLRSAGCALAEAAMYVVREYDGTHRLALAVSAWSKAIADEGGRGERARATLETQDDR